LSADNIGTLPCRRKLVGLFRVKVLQLLFHRGYVTALNGESKSGRPYIYVYMYFFFSRVELRFPRSSRLASGSFRVFSLNTKTIWYSFRRRLSTQRSRLAFNQVDCFIVACAFQWLN